MSPRVQGFLVGATVFLGIPLFARVRDDHWDTWLWMLTIAAAYALGISVRNFGVLRRLRKRDAQSPSVPDEPA